MDSNNRTLMVRERKIPAFKDGETNCLGLCMKSKEALIEICGILSPDDFYWQEHRYIFDTILELYKANQHVDVVTVTDSLSKKGLLEASKGRGYLTGLYDISLDVTKASAYAYQVRDWAVMRKMAEENERINSVIYGGDISSPLELVNAQSKSIYQITDRLSRNAVATMDDMFSDASGRYDVAYRTKPTYLGRSTGFSTIDKMTGGFQDNEYIIVAARPNVGKTAFGLHLCSHVAMNDKLPALIFSLEMPKERLLDRLVAMEARVDALKMRMGNLSSSEYGRVKEALDRLKESPILIQDAASCGSTVLEIQSMALKMLNKYGKLGMVMIDYISLIDPPHFRQEKHSQLADVSRQLNRLKFELPCPLVTLAQLNKNAVGRGKSPEEQRPIGTDIGGTDQIQRDADIIVMLHDPHPRQDYGKEPGASGSYSAKSNETNGGDYQDNRIEVIVEKSRNGSKGIMYASYDRASNRFREAV